MCTLLLFRSTEYSKQFPRRSDKCIRDGNIFKCKHFCPEWKCYVERKLLLNFQFCGYFKFKLLQQHQKKTVFELGNCVTMSLLCYKFASKLQYQKEEESQAFAEELFSH